MHYKVDVDESLNDFKAEGDAADTIDIIKSYDDEHKTKYWELLVEMAEDYFNDDTDYSAAEINEWLACEVPEYEEFSIIFQ